MPKRKLRKLNLETNTSRSDKEIEVKEIFLRLSKYNLNGTDFKTWMHLYAISNKNLKTPAISYECIGERISKGRSSVADSVSKLQELELLKAEKTEFRGANVYQVNLPKKSQ